MKIGIVSFQCFQAGGIKVYVRELLNRFVSMGHEVVVFAPNHSTQAASGLSPLVKIVEIPVSSIPFTSIVSFWLRLPGCFKRFVRSQGGFDIVHADTIADLTLTKDVAPQPRVVTAHHLGASVIRSLGYAGSIGLFGFSEEYGVAMLAEAISLERADRIVAVSQYTRSEILRTYPWIGANKIAVVYNGILERVTPTKLADVSGFRQKLGILQGEKMILFVGRLQRRKGLRFLLESIAPISKRLRLKLVIAGAGSSSSVQRLVKRLGLGGRVVCTGFLDEGDLALAFKAADLFVHPSAMEGFGLSAAEALQCGLPVVCTNVGALPEIMSSENGVTFVSFGNQSELATTIERVLQESDGKPRRHATLNERFSWDKTAAETLRIYDGLA